MNSLDRNDDPPFSRVFVVCLKKHTVDDLKDRFQEFGDVADAWLLKDKVTHESRGIAYVKFNKMSEALRAVTELHGKYLRNDDEKPLKVVIALPKAQKHLEDLDDDSYLSRLFIVSPPTEEDAELREIFKAYGEIDFIQRLKDKPSGTPKPVAYVKYKRAYDAAIAVENCEKRFRAVIAEPKASKMKRERERETLTSDPHLFIDGGHSSSRFDRHDDRSERGSSRRGMESYSSDSFHSKNVDDIRDELTSACVSSKLIVQVHPTLTQKEIGPLFDLVPGLKCVNLKKDFSTGRSAGIAYVVYESVSAAVYAREKLNGFQYPLGTPLVVNYCRDGAETMTMPAPLSPVRDSGIVQSRSACNVDLPPEQPLASSDAPVAIRLFVVCGGAYPPSDHQLCDIFCRFGDLIEVYLLSRKNHGFAKFASEQSGREAMAKLHGAFAFGCSFKVIEADPPKNNSESAAKRPRN